MDRDREVLRSGRKCTLVRSPRCYQIFDRESGSQIFGTFDLKTANSKFDQLEKTK